jgi:hypothetical protein
MGPFPTRCSPLKLLVPAMLLNLRFRRDQTFVSLALMEWHIHLAALRGRS